MSLVIKGYVGRHSLSIQSTMAWEERGTCDTTECHPVKGCPQVINLLFTFPPPPPSPPNSVLYTVLSSFWKPNSLCQKLNSLLITQFTFVNSIQFWKFNSHLETQIFIFENSIHIWKLNSLLKIQFTFVNSIHICKLNSLLKTQFTFENSIYFWKLNSLLKTQYTFENSIHFWKLNTLWKNRNTFFLYPVGVILQFVCLVLFPTWRLKRFAGKWLPTDFSQSKYQKTYWHFHL